MTDPEEPEPGPGQPPEAGARGDVPRLRATRPVARPRSRVRLVVLLLLGLLIMIAAIGGSALLSSHYRPITPSPTPTPSTR